MGKALPTAWPLPTGLRAKNVTRSIFFPWALRLHTDYNFFRKGATSAREYGDGTGFGVRFSLGIGVWVAFAASRPRPSDDEKSAD